MKENIFVIRDPKAFSLKFGWPKDADENLKHEAEFTIRFIIKRNESLAENKKKKRYWKIIVKMYAGNDIHEHRKQQNKWVAKMFS